jgi:hypothetical protein
MEPRNNSGETEYPENLFESEAGGSSANECNGILVNGGSKDNTLLQQQYKTKTSFTLRKICATSRFKSSLIENQRKEIFENGSSSSAMANGDLEDSFKSIQGFYLKLSSFFHAPRPAGSEVKKIKTITEMMKTARPCPEDDADADVNCVFETDFLRFSNLLSEEMLEALEHEMSAMFAVVSIHDERASGQSCAETQNNILISMAKWYKESNMLDVFKLCLKAIEYFLTYAYLKDEDLATLPLSNVRSHADLQCSEPEVSDRIRFVGKTGQSALNALKHIISVHIFLQTCVKLIKNTIDSKIMRCDCISLNGPCHCRPVDFLEARDTNIGADVLEGNCLSSFH